MLRWPRLFLLERLEQVVVLHQRVLHHHAAALAQAVEKAVVGGFCGVRDEAEHRVVEVVVDGLQHRLHLPLRDAAGPDGLRSAHRLNLVTVFFAPQEKSERGKSEREKSYC